MGKLVLIDGNSIANRAFYALPLLTNKQGIHTNAVLGFAQIILKIISDTRPDHLLVAFDAGKITFRHSEYQEYKGKRQKTPPELSEQFPLIKELLEAFGISYFELAGYEADDIIGTMAKKAEIEGMSTIIYSGDKDLLQLASEKVVIYLTRKGITEVDEFSPVEIMGKYQLTPAQIIDLKGLMGDSSDNIPGVPGVGEKTALKLLASYQTVEGVLANIAEILGKKLKENLTTYREQAILSKKLATIYCEVPMDLDLASVKYQGYQDEQVFSTLNKLGFQALIKRLGIPKGAEQEVEKHTPDLQLEFLSETNKPQWDKLLAEKQKLALHVEMDFGPKQEAKILGIAIANSDKQLFISFEQAKEWEEFQRWLIDETAPKWVFDGKQLEMNLFWLGNSVKGIEFDLMLGIYLLNPSDGTISLPELAMAYNYHGLSEDENIYGKGAKRSVPELSILQKHVVRKAQAIFYLTPIIEGKLQEDGLTDLLHKIEIPLSQILAQMEKNGIKLDRRCLEQMGEEITLELEILTKKIHALAGRDFNINSPKQLGEILFDKLQLPIIKKTKTGYSTDVEVLEKLEPQHEIIGYILNFRQLGKLHSTYIEGLIKEINLQTGNIHTTFNQALTATGRLSSTEPNLQNIPIRLEEGRKIRKAFVSSEAGWEILSADYSQIELRVLAHIANDQNLITAFKEDLDIHTKTAMDVFGVQMDEVTSNMRRQAKAVNFGIVYGISDYGLAQNLHISRKEAQQFIDKYFAVFQGVKDYMVEIVAKAKKDGYVSTLVNRRRYLPDINSSNYNIRSFAERTAMNTPIQGTASDIIKIAMVRMSEQLSQNKLRSRLLLQVHDELIFEVPEEEIAKMQSIVKRTMEEAIELKVPLKVDLNVGPTWFDAK